ncbi:hypothetical protein EVA_12029, partial [gut metagenome]
MNRTQGDRLRLSEVAKAERTRRSQWFEVCPWKRENKHLP